MTRFIFKVFKEDYFNSIIWLTCKKNNAKFKQLDHHNRTRAYNSTNLYTWQLEFSFCFDGVLPDQEWAILLQLRGFHYSSRIHYQSVCFPHTACAHEESQQEVPKPVQHISTMALFHFLNVLNRSYWVLSSCRWAFVFSDNLYNSVHLSG